MKASELVALLNAEIEKYGDLEVRYIDGSEYVTPLSVTTYDYHGNKPREQSEDLEIYIY